MDKATDEVGDLSRLTVKIAVVPVSTVLALGEDTWNPPLPGTPKASPLMFPRLKLKGLIDFPQQ